MRLPTKEELQKRCTKNLTVNAEVAKLADNKTPTRRLDTNLEVGDTFYIKETFNLNGEDWGCANPLKINYKADRESVYKWFPSAWMIPEYARHFYEVVEVREEYLQDITYEDICKEGKNCEYYDIYDTGWMKNKATFYGDINNKKFKSKAEWMLQWWVDLWNSTAEAPYRWKDNPRVKVITYKELEYQK